MSSFSKSLLACVVALSVTPAFAQPKGDAGSGPTSGATTTNDAGSGPIQGAKANAGSTAANTSDGTTDNSAGVTPGPKSTGGSQPVTPATTQKQ